MQSVFDVGFLIFKSFDLNVHTFKYLKLFKGQIIRDWLRKGFNRLKCYFWQPDYFFVVKCPEIEVLGFLCLFGYSEILAHVLGILCYNATVGTCFQM